METMAVIKHFDVLDHIASGLVSGSINDISGPFGFQAVKRSFQQRHYPSSCPFGSYYRSCHRYSKTSGNHHRHTGCRGRSDVPTLLPAFGANRPSTGHRRQAMPLNACSWPSRQFFSNTDRLSLPNTAILPLSKDKRCHCTKRRRVDPHESYDPKDLGLRADCVCCPVVFLNFLRRFTQTPALFIKLRARYRPTSCP